VKIEYLTPIFQTVMPFDKNTNHKNVANELMRIVPSLTTNPKNDNFEPTLIYLPTKDDPYGGKK
jgi:hypothetical protein